MTHELAALQNWFLDACTAHTAPVVEAVLRPGPRLTASERLDIYREGYVHRLVECLVDDYPALQHALGEARFGELARAYVNAYPSRSPSLNYFGRHMADFCAALEGSVHCFNAELARFEWSLVEVIHAEASAPLGPERLGSIQEHEWQNARFTPSSALRWFRFAHPVNTFYQSFREGESALLPAPEASAVVVQRRGTAVWRVDLPLVRYELLERLLSGMPLGEALELAARDGAASDTEVLAWFSEWMQDGLFASISV
ncbi:MAG: DNA-binding domain-containing protein [Polyangiaceae bacterium]